MVCQSFFVSFSFPSMESYAVLGKLSLCQSMPAFMPSILRRSTRSGLIISCLNFSCCSN